MFVYGINNLTSSLYGGPLVKGILQTLCGGGDTGVWVGSVGLVQERAGGSHHLISGQAAGRL